MIMSRQHIAWLPLLVIAVIAMLSHTLSVQQSNSRHPLVSAVQAYDGKSHDNAYKLSVATTIVRSPDRHGDRVTPTEPLWTRLRSGFALPTGRSGPVQAQLRAWFGWSYGDYWFPEIRSLGGAVVMLSLVLYPYVYMLARSAFLDQSLTPLEVGRTLGAGPWRSFFTVALPLARPAIITGLTLALMETLADYGTVQYFGVSTFTTGIFRTWFGLGDAAAAAQLSALLMSLVFVLILLERWSRRRARFHHTGSRNGPAPRCVLTGAPRWVAFTACLLPVLFGFILPALQLTAWAVETAARLSR